VPIKTFVPDFTAIARHAGRKNGFFGGFSFQSAAFDQHSRFAKWHQTATPAMKCRT